MQKVLITTVPFGDKDRLPLEILENNNIEFLINPLNKKLTEDELVELVSDFDVIIAGTELITKKVIDAKDAFISPGFIDIHTHSDISLYIDSRGLSKVKQGVTTDVTGNCGYSPFPLNKKARKDHQSNLNPILW